jgi:hypothetical protein
VITKPNLKEIEKMSKAEVKQLKTQIAELFEENKLIRFILTEKDELIHEARLKIEFYLNENPPLRSQKGGSKARKVLDRWETNQNEKITKAKEIIYDMVVLEDILTDNVNEIEVLKAKVKTLKRSGKKARRQARKAQTYTEVSDFDKWAYQLKVEAQAQLEEEQAKIPIKWDIVNHFIISTYGELRNTQVGQVFTFNGISVKA